MKGLVSWKGQPHGGGIKRLKAIFEILVFCKVGLDQGGRLSYAVMLLWSLWSAILLLVPLEAAEEDNVRAGRIHLLLRVRHSTLESEMLIICPCIVKMCL